MIRRSPAEKYIEYLLVHPDGYSDEALIELMRLKQLDFLGPAYLARLRLNLRPPRTFAPDNKFHRPSSRFLTAHGLYYLFHPDKDTKDALKLLDDPRAKEAVETMLIGRDSFKLIAHRLAHLGFKVQPKAIERYRFFLFNIDIVDSTELNAILRYRLDYVPQRSDSYEDQMRVALKSASYEDPRKSLAANPLPQVASMLNQIRMGYMPSRADLTRMLSLTQTVAITRGFNTALGGRGRTTAAEVRDWALAAKLFGEILAEAGSPDTELQQDLRALALKTETDPVPHINMLSNGNHTVDLQPVELLEGVGEGVHDGY